MNLGQAEDSRSKTRRDVFVNCPFDADFKPLLDSILFVVIYLGFMPRLASERSDSSEIRLDKICELIEASTLSIHDLSHLKPKRGEFSRMNMPFELGIDYGARTYGPADLANKKFLILGTTPHDFKIAASDLSGVDIKSHFDELFAAVRAIRDWFYETVDVKSAQPPKEIWYALEDFQRDLADARIEQLRSQRPGISLLQAQRDVEDDIDAMPVSEYIDSVTVWVEDGFGAA